MVMTIREEEEEKEKEKGKEKMKEKEKDEEEGRRGRRYMVKQEGQSTSLPNKSEPWGHLMPNSHRQTFYTRHCIKEKMRRR